MPNLHVINGDSVHTLGMAEYLWLDEGKLRAKVRAIPIGENSDGSVPILGAWNTHDAQGNPVLLSPCHYLPDPLRPQPSYLVLCEVRDLQDMSVPENKRAALRFLERKERFLDMLWGFRQEYKLSGSKAETVAEKHFEACLDAGLLIHSAHWDSQRPWDFKIGPRNIPKEIDLDEATSLVAGDHLCLARRLLDRIAWESGLEVSYKKLSVFFSTEGSRTLGATRFDVKLPNIKNCVSVTDHKFSHFEIDTCSSDDPYEAAAWVLTQLWEVK